MPTEFSEGNSSPPVVAACESVNLAVLKLDYGGKTKHVGTDEE